eukprot:NODE_278_length_10899_cov_0.613704.p2 type:complete len:175 gc:universal NODE_278_length_10899_cov_0.613704:9431-9955(+)
MHLITPVQRAKRLAWAKEHKNTDWNAWLFSDDSYIEVAENGAQSFLMMRGQPIKEFQVQQMDKSPKKILIWGLIHYNGGGKVIISKDTIRKERYVQILKIVVKSFYRNNPDTDWIFMQDGASAHTAAISLEELDESGIDYRKWPTSSPDLCVKNIVLYCTIDAVIKAKSSHTKY